MHIVDNCQEFQSLEKRVDNWSQSRTGFHVEQL